VRLTCEDSKVSTKTCRRNARLFPRAIPTRAHRPPASPELPAANGSPDDNETIPQLGSSYHTEPTRTPYPGVPPSPTSIKSRNGRSPQLNGAELLPLPPRTEYKASYGDLRSAARGFCYDAFRSQPRDRYRSFSASATVMRVGPSPRSRPVHTRANAGRPAKRRIPCVKNAACYNNTDR
jgi:hypothetical protein